MGDTFDPVLQEAINRGSALPIGTPQTGHVSDCDEPEKARNYLQPGGYGAYLTDDTSGED